MASRERLARLVCADSEIMDVAEIENLARYVFEKHLQQITEGLLQVLSGLDDTSNLPVMPVGAGGFLAKEVARRLDLSIIDIDLEPCPASLTALPAYAVACLLAQDTTGMADD